MKLHESIDGAAAHLRDAVGTKTERLENEIEPIDQDELFNALVQFGELKALVREYDTRINALLTTHMRINGDKYLEYGNLVAERKFSSARKNWEHQTILEAVVNSALATQSGVAVDPSTGEVMDLTSISRPIIDSVVTHLTRAAAIRDWRVTALRAMVPGMNPDDFCEVEKSERVSIRRKQ